MHDLAKIAEECISEMKRVGIPVRDNEIADIKTDNIDSFGSCTDDGYYKNFIITIRNDLIQDICPLVDLKQIIIHELIHTCPRCWVHGKTWRKYAMIMNDAYGYSLLEDKDYDSIFHKDKPILHKYVCTKCGSVFNSRENGEFAYKCSFCSSWYEEL